MCTFLQFSQSRGRALLRIIVAVALVTIMVILGFKQCWLRRSLYSGHQDQTLDWRLSNDQIYIYIKQVNPAPWIDPWTEFWTHVVAFRARQGWHQKTQPKITNHEKTTWNVFFFVFLLVLRFFIVNHLVYYLNLTLNVSKHFWNMNHVLKTYFYSFLYR